MSRDASSGTPATLDPAASWGADESDWGVLVHGGAGEVRPEEVAAHLAGCRAAAQAAATVLRGGGSALDAVERAVWLLEDDPVFNAGTGACLNAEGLVELDAALIEGTGLRAGAVCALPPFAHPIAIARAVLDDARHVLYAAHGAERFALERGFPRLTSEAMTTPATRARWEAAKLSQASATVHPSEGWGGGTVGAVARDARGGVAAATSTGGLVNKRVGRVGDSPILGAGTYADDEGGACSATGAGEAILRIGMARTAIDAMRAGSLPEEAARAAIRALGARVRGTGGLILVDRAGRLGLARNTPSMSWAAATAALDDAAGT